MLRDLTQDGFNVLFLLTNVAETFSDESVHNSQSCCLLHRQLKIRLNNNYLYSSVFLEHWYSCTNFVIFKQNISVKLKHFSKSKDM
jgi:hypothetical protein